MNGTTAAAGNEIEQPLLPASAPPSPGDDSLLPYSSPIHLAVCPLLRYA